MKDSNNSASKTRGRAGVSGSDLTVYACSVHTHTNLCDGKATPEEMAKTACATGVKYYGFSGHSYTDCVSDRGNVLPFEPNEYKKRVLRLREEYENRDENRMEILLGIEMDSLSPMKIPPEGFDYWIGSVHHLIDNNLNNNNLINNNLDNNNLIDNKNSKNSNKNINREYAVDWDREKFIICRDELFHGDVYAFAEEYYKQVGDMAEKKPDILGHFDLITKYNEDKSLIDENNLRYKTAALENLKRADINKSLLEINTGAMARGYRTKPYPADFILKAWREMGGRIIITADAHAPDKIVYGYDIALESAKNAGFRESAVLTRSGVVMCKI